MNARTRVKFCGMTSAADVALAVEAGADAVGFIVAPSARRVPGFALPALLDAVPPFVTAVIVAAGETDVDLAAFASGGALLQFSGAEPPELCERLANGAPYVKTFHVPVESDTRTFDRESLAAYVHALPLIDSSAGGAFGGTGRTFDWRLVAELARERALVLSGGLTPDNVAEAVRTVRPYAVDVRSGIETNGAKDPAKMRAFVRAVREADGETVTLATLPNI